MAQILKTWRDDKGMPSLQNFIQKYIDEGYTVDQMLVQHYTRYKTKFANEWQAQQILIVMSKPETNEKEVRQLLG